MFATFLLMGVLARFANGYGWDEVSDLKNFNPDQFKQWMSPVLEIVANTYRYPGILPISGWEFAPGIEPLDPQAGGAHALVYIENGGERLILGFRGTDLEDLVDKCADMELFHAFVPGMTPPNETLCARYSAQTLDYYSQAVNFTKKVLEAHPGAPLLLTGHSLGAALAYLVSAHFSSFDSVVIPVVSFGTPPMKSVLERKLVGLDHPGVVYAVGDEWDSVMWPLGNQVGNLCLYEREEPRECGICTSLNFPLEDQRCLSCFLQTHYLKHFMELVDSSQVKPSCVLKSASCPSNNI